MVWPDERPRDEQPSLESQLALLLRARDDLDEADREYLLDIVRATMANPVSDIDPRYKDMQHDLIAIATEKLVPVAPWSPCSCEPIQTQPSGTPNPISTAATTVRANPRMETMVRIVG